MIDGRRGCRVSGTPFSRSRRPHRGAPPSRGVHPRCSRRGLRRIRTAPGPRVTRRASVADSALTGEPDHPRAPPLPQRMRPGDASAALRQARMRSHEGVPTGTSPLPCRSPSSMAGSPWMTLEDRRADVLPPFLHGDAEAPASAWSNTDPAGSPVHPELAKGISRGEMEEAEKGVSSVLRVLRALRVRPAVKPRLRSDRWDMV
jgi:hypothetical protein